MHGNLKFNDVEYVTTITIIVLIVQTTGKRKIMHEISIIETNWTERQFQF